MTAVLGLNAFHGDASACLLVDGRIVAAAEEERFRRVKHWAGVPTEAIRFCLRQGGVSLTEIDMIAINRKPNANMWRRVRYVLSKRPGLSILKDRFRARRKIGGIDRDIAAALDTDVAEVTQRIRGFEHHLCHLASAFFVSPYEAATVVSEDSFGDFSSAMCGRGQANSLWVTDQVYFPNSLGTYYLAMTQFLGFPNYGDEYKVMGLAGHGEPEMSDAMEQILYVDDRGDFHLNLEMFRHHNAGTPMTWDNGAPELGAAYSEKMIDLLGPPRLFDEPLSDRHKALAASVQQQYEKAFQAYVSAGLRRQRSTTLCLAGGCAMNSLANGKLAERLGVENLYIPLAPGDAGGAIGAALLGDLALGSDNPRVEMRRADLGPSFGASEIATAIAERAARLKTSGCEIRMDVDDRQLVATVAKRLDEGGIVGWFQGGMEWGPRALGNRSILGDPRRSETREILNRKIKLREPFRPFAPSILREEAENWFEGAVDVPFMGQVLKVKSGVSERVPAIVHIDGTGRLQTVDRADNALYHALISELRDRTGIPMLLNTSFNENEPIVATPREALDCFLRTGMDMLAMESTIIERPSVG